MLSRRPREKSKKKKSKLASFKGLSIVFSFQYPFVEKVSIFLKNVLVYILWYWYYFFKSIIIDSDFE